MTTPAELSAIAIDIAREAGELAARRRAEGVAIADTKSSLADIVTAADREVELLIRERLHVLRPGDGFLGEESEGEVGTTGITWVVDPIDGTVNYAAGFAHYAVSIAAVEGGMKPREWSALTGVVYAPALGDLYTATRGGGAFLNDEPIAVAGGHPAGALLATGFGYDASTHAGDLETLTRVFAIARDLRRMGAASLDLAAVAAGRIDGYYERGLSPWDHAAGALLVSEAGGTVTWLDVEDRRPMIVAAAPDVHEKLSAILP